MNMIDAVEAHIAEYKSLKSEVERLSEDLKKAEWWLSIYLNRNGGRCQLKTDELLTPHGIGGGLAYGSIECHFFDYYSASTLADSGGKRIDDGGSAESLVETQKKGSVMKVRDVIKLLLEYNLDAEFSVIANCYPVEEWSFSYGSSEGVTMRTAESVSIDVGKINATAHGDSPVERVVETKGE